MKSKSILYILGGLLVAWCSAGAQGSESLFATRLKEQVQPRIRKFEGRTKRICRRHSLAAPSVVVLIPRLYYKESVRENKRVAPADYFRFVDPASARYHAALVSTDRGLYLLLPSPIGRSRYNAFPADKLEVVSRLLAVLREVRPDVVFTISNAPHIFLVKGSRVLVFDREKGAIMEQEPMLKKIIDDPLSFRYVPAGN